MNQPAAETARRYVALQPGDPAPWFHQRTESHPRYAFDTVGGRYVLMLFVASAADAQGKSAIDAVLANADMFDDHSVCFFGVTSDTRDESEGRLRNRIPGIRYFWD